MQYWPDHSDDPNIVAAPNQIAISPDQILRALAEADDLPRDALKAACDQRAAMIPLFLAEIENVLAEPSELEIKSTALFYIFHLLGSWREKSGYRLLARLLRFTLIDEILEDAIISTSHRVMAAVFDGDPQPLYNIILDHSADEYVRARMCETVAMLVMRGEINRAEAIRFLREAFDTIRPQARCFVWQGWQSAIAMLGATALMSLVKEAFDRGFVDKRWLRFHHFERDLAFAVAHPGQIRSENDGEYTLFGDTVAELSTWYGFRDGYENVRDEYQNDWERLNNFEDLPAPFGPYVNPHRHIGRNDPCPCGSGKKFKKCCMA